MFYDFPTGLSLEETRDVVARHNDALGVTAFIEANRGEYTIFNYVVSFDGSFPDFTGDPARDREIAIIRECRGLTFYSDTGEVAARKYFKFFNLLQREETQPHAIDWSHPHIILIKADGSMITPYLRRDCQIEWHTKMGRTDVSEPVNAFAAGLPQYEAFARYCRTRQITPIFEWCSRKQKIVIDYPEDKLVLTAMRNDVSGTFVGYSELLSHASFYGIPVIGRIEGSVNDPSAFLEAVRVLQGEEGYVVRFDNGHMVKAKAEDYLRLHNMVDILQLEKNVLELVLSGSLDDAKPLMSDDSRQRVEAYVEAVERGAQATAARLGAYAAQALAEVGDDRKRYAIEKVNIPSVPQRERAFLFSIAGGRDPVQVILDHVRKNTGTGTRVDEIRDLIGGVRWDDFRDHTIVVED